MTVILLAGFGIQRKIDRAIEKRKIAAKDVLEDGCYTRGMWRSGHKSCSKPGHPCTFKDWENDINCCGFNKEAFAELIQDPPDKKTINEPVETV